MIGTPVKPFHKMFLSQKKSKDATKGLGSVKIDSLTAPSHLNTKELLPASLQYRPASKIPTRGATELTREDRHSQHLRKKRAQKVEKKRKDSLLRDLAQSNKKLRVKMEKEDALKKLGKNRNVQIIGGKSASNKKMSGYTKNKSTTKNTSVKPFRK